VTADSAIETLARRDRVAVWASIGGLSVLAWLYLVWDASRMAAMPAMEMPMPWSPREFLMVFAMWAIMMVGMMLPSASPMILLYARVARGNAGRGTIMPGVHSFASGYIAVWTAFSLLAATSQVALEQLALMSPTMVVNSGAMSGLFLLVAGAYQLLPWKNACLKRCRGPFQFIMLHWRNGPWGPFRMGLEHGVYCLGCCWALMLLLFVGGVMNLLWVAIVAGFVLVEKVLPAGPLAGRIAGIGLVFVGLWQFIVPG
jgi:predicted metal-binding membrane protein